MDRIPGWLAAIALCIAALSFARAQGTGPTIPDTAPAPLDNEQTRQGEPPRPARHDERGARTDDTRRPRSERLPPEVRPDGQTGQRASHQDTR